MNRMMSVYFKPSYHLLSHRFPSLFSGQSEKHWEPSSTRFQGARLCLHHPARLHPVSESVWDVEGAWENSTGENWDSGTEEVCD